MAALQYRCFDSAGNPLAGSIIHVPAMTLLNGDTHQATIRSLPTPAAH